MQNVPSLTWAEEVGDKEEGKTGRFSENTHVPTGRLTVTAPQVRLAHTVT